MKNYGIPYMGSKSKIAPAILKRLPSGKRFVDLFGGGFAMSHAAILSGKYERVWYRDFNAGVTHLVEDAYNGKYNYSVFKPEFITRERFNREYKDNAYIRQIWSFGNKGTAYLYGKDIEHIKHVAHDFVVFGKWSPELEKIAKGITKAVTAKDIRTRRMQFTRHIKSTGKSINGKLQHMNQLECLQQLEELSRLECLQQLEELSRLERLQQLEELSRLERLQQLEFGHGLSYDDYEYQDGDVVYCDPPYIGTAEYVDAFDYDKFFDWAASRNFDVYFSNYPIYDKRFVLVWASQLRSTLGSGNNSVNFECLYKNVGE